ncbi:MAG: BamA/TamA family outer membrane protein [Paludibacteraceae bacterium]|nr:BamA/TamA family outer membrane protein [Paludibacteraceae bacterium]
MKHKKRLIWIIPTAIIGTVFALLLLVLGLCSVPSVRKKILDKGVSIAAEKTGYDIQLDDLYISVFHQSPMSLFRDSLVVEIDGLFIGHASQDTLVSFRHLSLHALPLALECKPFSIYLRDTIPVYSLTLDDAVLHTDSMIDACTVDASFRHLYLTSPGIVLDGGQYPLHDLHLAQADVAVTLHDTPIDSTMVDTTALQLAFDVPDGQLDTIRFRLQPMGLDIATQSLRTCALADVGGELYAVSHIALGTSRIGFGDFSIPIDTLYGDANVNLANQLITTDGLHVSCDSLDAQVDVKSTRFDMETMETRFAADATMQGNALTARGMYNINTEQYDLQADLKHIDLSPFLSNPTRTLFTGSLKAQGQGLDYKSRQTRSHVVLDLPNCIYDSIDASGIQLDAQLVRHTLSGDLHLPVSYKDSAFSAQVESENQFRIIELFSKYPQVDYHTHLQQLQAHIADEQVTVPFMDLDFQTDSATQCHLVADNLDVHVQTPQHLLSFLQAVPPLMTTVSDSATIGGIMSCTDLTLIDTLRNLLPALTARVKVNHNSVVQPFLDKYGLDINSLDLSLSSDTTGTTLLTDISIPALEPEDTTALRLPTADAHIEVVCQPSTTDLTITSSAGMTDGLLSMHNICTDLTLNTHIHRHEHDLTGSGSILFDSINIGATDLGNQAITFTLEPSPNYHKGAFSVQAQLDDISLDLVDSLLSVPELDLNGYLRTAVTLDGLPSSTDVSAQVLPIEVKAKYQPLEAELSLGEIPITMEHNQIHLNGLPIYGVDSSYLALYGGFDLDSLAVDITFESDSFAPLRLLQGGPLLIYGDFATALRGRVSGPVDHLATQADVTILPITNLTYPIDAKNLAQVNPQGTVRITYADSLQLGGEIVINDGLVKYSPKAYPMMPFRVDSGSYIRFNGPVGATEMAVSASQQIKASVQTANEDSRRVEFNTGVSIHGQLDSIGIHSIDFFLEAPKDERITQELNTVSVEDREGLAATLLATGMYVGESNVATQQSGYALSSIVNSKINAAMANSKAGKVVDIDISSGEKMHNNNVKSQDLGLTISKSFLQDKLKITVGTSLSDNPQVNKTYGLLNNISADYKLTPKGGVLLHLFSKRDFDNVLEGELYKSGIGIRATKDWKKLRRDSLAYTYSLTGDCDVVYRSNNSIGPDANIIFAIRNLWGNGETFSIRYKCAYYWSLRKRFSGDPTNKNTYKLGADMALTFPYLHWLGDHNPEGNTRYLFGYQYENIAGGYSVHKYYASFSYLIRSGQFITHSFTPFSLSVIQMKASDANLTDKAADYPQLIAVLAGDEFVPSIEYSLVYDNYRTKRAVNTFFDWDIKESGNIINGLFCAFGHDWNKKDKKIGAVIFNQFVKTSLELRNKFNLTPKICFATRLYAGAVIPIGNSEFAPLSEKYYTGGPNSLRAASPYAYGPGNFYSPKYNQSFFHAGDIRLEANVEFRFPIVWKLYGAVFADVGNVWNWEDTWKVAERTGQTDLVKKFEIRDDLKDGIRVETLGKQLALGTGFGLRLDIESIVIRLDLGVAIHAPYATGKSTYYNIPDTKDGFRFNFGIGYPF